MRRLVKKNDAEDLNPKAESVNTEAIVEKPKAISVVIIKPIEKLLK